MPFVITLADWAIQILIYLIVIASLMSWFRPSARNPVVRLLHTVVDPVLHPIRAILPAIGGMDFSPLVAILILGWLQHMLR
jgi:YggT family protein